MKRVIATAKKQIAGALSNWILLCVLIASTLIVSLFVPYYLAPKNLLDATRSGGELGLIGLGMATVMLIGGIDLSVGSIFALSAIIMGIFIKLGVNAYISAVLCVVTGLLAGTANGLIISRLKIPPIIVTLATMAAYRGIAIGLSKGVSYPVPQSFYFIGQGGIFGIPTQLIMLVGVAVIVSTLLRRTTFGLSLFAIGNSEEAARYSAIRASLAKTTVYAVSGFLSAIASLVYVARVVSAKADFGTGYELDAITIAVLGGAALAGGKANVTGTVIAMLIIVLLRRGLTMGFVQTEVQSIFIGLILIISVALKGSLRSDRVARHGKNVSA
jgi:rhamnose transport system permease protein